MSYKQSLRDYYSTTPEFKSIPSDQLVSGMDYQRVVKDKNVLKIVNSFNPMKFDPPIVSYRDGKYLLVDGQHRVSALQYMNGGKPTNVFCRVYKGSNYLDEVSVVTHHDDGHTKMSMLEHINAAAKGDDDEAHIVREFMSVCASCGVSFSSDTNEVPNEYAAIKTLLTAYKKYGATDFAEVMRLLNDCWHGQNGAKKNQIINAMFAFHGKYKGRYDRKRAITKFGNYSCHQLLATSKTMTGTMNESLVVLLVNAYNKGATEDRRI